MDVREINDEYAVSGQITAQDVETLKDMGYRSIVCHRPDNEAEGQPQFSDIAAEAERLGLEVRHVPVGQNGVQAEQVRAFVDCLDEMARPMLGYCRSGARSTKIYEMARHIRN